MGHVTIEFRGICTQIKLPVADHDVLHRTVCVKWDQSKELLSYAPYNKVIPPHYATLTVEGGNEPPEVGALETSHALAPLIPGSWLMAGVRLFIENSVGDRVAYDRSSFHVPSLTTLAPDFGPLSRTVVYGNDAWCHFDVFSGTFRGVQYDAVNGSWYTYLDVPTSDDHAFLRIEKLGDPAVRGFIRLAHGAKIGINNTAEPGEDKSYDFYLHYLTAQNPPPDATLPPEALAAPEVPSNFQGCFEIGPGCSNSNFP